ncbi:MAG: DUF1800 domain-containing protein [Acidobacteriota bacterium]
MTQRAGLRFFPLALLVIAFSGAPRAEIPLATTQPSAVPEQPDTATIVHVLNRTGFGPAPGDLERVRALGLARYIDQQLHPSQIGDGPMAARLADLTTLGMSAAEIAEQYFVPAEMERRKAAGRAAASGGEAAEMEPRKPGAPAGGADSVRAARSPAQRTAVMREREVLGELAQQKILRAVYSNRQLEEVMVDFWFNHFNVFAGKGAVRVYLTEYERDAIRPHVLGTFRDLLGATASSPAMLFYLDNWQSAAAAADTAPAQRIARGRVGLFQRPRADVRPRPKPGGSQRVRGINENYARELMELHTLGVDGGYTQKDVQEVARAFTGWTIITPRQGGSFRYEPRMHDAGAKVILGHRLAAGGDRSDGERVLDILAEHPATAHFIAFKLARRFVADTPPPALVDRAAATFLRTHGDIREVLRAILTSPEFFAPAVMRAKVKTPFEFVVSAARASGLEIRPRPLIQAVRDLGMPLYACQPPTGYADRADAWVNTGALLNRMNFAVSLTRSGGRGGGLGAAAAGALTSPQVVERELLGGQVSASTTATVARATEPALALALLLGSPEFQKR